MAEPQSGIDKSLVEKALHWFQDQFRQSVVSPIESQFPQYPLPQDIQTALQPIARMIHEIDGWAAGSLTVAQVAERLGAGEPTRLPLFKQAILRYRRHRAGYTKALTEKTHHLELTGTLEQEVKALDAVVNEDWFQQIQDLRLPRLKDFLPVQYIESVSVNQNPFPPRQHEEKFHILQAHSLILPDIAYFRAKCEDRELPLGIAFFDIDNFKSFNTEHTEPKVDRNLLPRFMQAIEAHVFHHGYAYRHGGDEFLLLIPSLSRSLMIAFLDDLRVKLADLSYPDISGKTTVSIGLCIADADSPLTDRELCDRAAHAKKFAKQHRKNCIATYKGNRLLSEELEVVRPTPT